MDKNILLEDWYGVGTYQDPRNKLLSSSKAEQKAYKESLRAAKMEQSKLLEEIIDCDCSDED